MRGVMSRAERSARNIKAVRTRVKMSQEEFAGAVGITTNTVGRLERGDVQLSAESALKINDKFHVSMDYLYGFSNEEEGEPPCSKICEDLLNAQNLIEIQGNMIQDLQSRIEAIQKLTAIKLKKLDCPT